MQPSYHRARLLERKAELSVRLRKIDGDLGTTRSHDDDDRAVEQEDMEVLEAIGDAGLIELKAIEAALERLDDGTYGRCAKCGAQISEKRLTAVPHAALCTSCMTENAN